MDHRLHLSGSLSSSTNVPSQFRYISRKFHPDDVIVLVDFPKDWDKWTDLIRDKRKEDFMRRTYGRDLFVFRDPDQLRFGAAGAGQINVRKIYTWFEVQDVTGAVEKYDESTARIVDVMEYASELASLQKQLNHAMMPYGVFWDPAKEPDISGIDWTGKDRVMAETVLDDVVKAGTGDATLGELISAVRCSEF